MNTSSIAIKSKIKNHLRFGVLGLLLGLAAGMPTTALGWNYSNVPLFWTQGIKPNVALMLDNSGSMNAITTNESFQRATIAGTLSTQEWYWCNGDYNAATLKCNSKNNSKIRGFAVYDWLPVVNNTSVNAGRSWITTYSSPSSCTSSNTGFFKNTAGNVSSTQYGALGICIPNHGMPNGTRIDLVSAATNGALATAGPFWVVNASTNGFQLSQSLGGAPATLNLKLGTSGTWKFQGYTTQLPNYIDQTVALCNVTQAPGSANFYTGLTGNTVWLNDSTAAAATNIPDDDTVGALVSNNTTANGGTRDSCVRWKMASTKRYQGDSIQGYDYTRWAKGTMYWTPETGTTSTDQANSVTSLYPRHLLNTLMPATGNASLNFDDKSTYPDTDSDPGNFVPALDNMVIPGVTRIEAAREVAQKIVLDFNNKMNIGLFTLKNNTTQAPVAAIPDGSSPATWQNNLIAATTSMLPADMPQSALDGVLGHYADTQSSGTPLSATQAAINNYFKGVSGATPIKYRCQKNYSVLMTDGDPTSDESSYTLDQRSQQGYTNDAMTTSSTPSLDADGKSWDDPTNGGQWALQNIVTYTVGLGLENNLLKRTPLVNQVNVAKTGISGNKITLANHGLKTGDYIHIISGAATGLTNGNYYYAVKIDANTFKLAAASASGDTSASTTNTRGNANTCAATGTTGCVNVTGGSGTMVISTGPGKSFFSFTPDQLALDMASVFNSINNLTASASAVSTNTKQFSGTGTSLVYQARFNTEDWSGEVAAYQIVVDGTGKATVDTSKTATPYWTTKQTLNGPADRTANVFTWNPTSGTAGTPVNFAWANLNATQQAALGGATNGPNVVSWLMGNTVAGYRDHSPKGLLGDVLNSDPVFLAGLNMGYQTLPPSNMASCVVASDYSSATGTGCTGAETYSTYMTASKSRPPMIYVGANDGMLHALNANTGVETMAFLPNAVYRDFVDANNNGVYDAGETTENKLYNLTQPGYDHRFFVDGNVTAGDVFMGSVWKTYLVGALGRGGRSIYALDVTSTAYSATSTVKWEFSHPDMGYTYGKPVIGRFGDNNWYAIVPNGLDSNQSRASVFVVNLANPADYHELTTNVGSPTLPNGMMAVQVRVNSQRTITDIYAGDMRGNIWKFNVYNSGTSSVVWPASGTKLFTAGDATTGTPQAITGGIRIGKEPSGMGSLIFFGTGKYFETTDNVFSGTSVPQIDSFYSVLDDGTTTGITRTSLQAQSFTMSGTNMRTSTQTAVTYSGPGSKKGWYIDLLNGAGGKQGERVISTPVLYGGRVIFVSIIPLSGGTCGGEGSSWLNELDALTGGMLNNKVLDTNGDGKIDSADAQVSSMQLDGLASDPSIISGQDRDYKVIGSTSTNKSVQVVSETAPPSGGGLAGGKGRMSWRQLQ